MKHEYILDPVRADGIVCGLHSGRCDLSKNKGFKQRGIAAYCTVCFENGTAAADLY